MAIRRVPVETVADPIHGKINLEGEPNEVLLPDRIYVNPTEGTVFDGRKGHTVGQLTGNEIEIPRTTWY